MVEHEVLYDEIGRIYRVKGIDLYSVTTCLGHTADHSFLEVWKERNPDHKRIAAQAAQLGTDFHTLGEHYLNNTESSEVQWFAKKMFSAVQPLLSPITNVVTTEHFLYDLKVRLAGRTDAIVYWENELAILDFKCLNYTNPKWITDYWIQTCIYAWLYFQMTGLMTRKLVLVCGNKKQLNGKVFVSEPKFHAKAAAKRVADFHEKVLTIKGK